MIANKRPIRTYQRKATRKPFTSVSLVPPIERYDSVKRTPFNNNSNGHDSVNHDQFETTFDRVAKGVVVPPLPFDANQDDLWSSGDSDGIAIDPIKSPKHEAFSPFSHNNMFNLSHENVIMPKRERKKPQRYKSEIALTKEILPKKIKITSVNGKTQPKKKIQRRKKRTNNIQVEKAAQHEFNKFNYKCNEKTSFDTTSNSEYIKDDISYNRNGKRLHQSISEIDKSTNDTRENNKYLIKPSFVKLKRLDVKKLVKKEYASTSAIFKKKQHIISSTPIGKYMRLSMCRVVLSPIDINMLDAKSRISIINTKDDIKSSKEYLEQESSVLLSSIDTNIRDVLDAEKKTSIINVKEDVSIIVPSNGHLKQEGSTCSLNTSEYSKMAADMQEQQTQVLLYSQQSSEESSVLLSSIDTNIRDVLDTEKKTSVINVKEDISIIVPSNGYLKQEGSTCSLNTSEYSKMAADMQEQQTQVLLYSQQSSIPTDSTAKNEVISSDEDFQMAPTQKYADYDVEMNSPNLNISADTDESQSLFDDTEINRNYSVENIIENNVENRYATNTLQYIPAKVDTTALSDTSVDLNLKQRKPLLDGNAYANPEYVSPSGTYALLETEILENFDNINIRQKHQSQRKKSTKMDVTKVANYENSENESVTDNKHNLSRSQGIVDAKVLLTKLQDPIRIPTQRTPHITLRRTKYSKWHLNMSNISNSLRNRPAIRSSKISPNVIVDECSNIPLVENNIKSFKNMNSSLNYIDSIDMTQQCCDNINIETEIFLKPGKCWIRSLSILNNINAESDLDKLSIGKGKNWRHSVRNILDMQKQGICRSCLKPEEDLFHGSNISTTGDNKCKTLDSTSNARFSKRISVRVVPNNTSIKYNDEDTLFLEVFGIKTKNSSKSKVLQQKKIPIRDIQHNNGGQILETNLRTVREVVLQRCSQNCYLSFSECFPDSYLEHCRKIGEGVYGEVFLYEYNDIKSVIKIIPIEGKELVNGEPQKKFNEILSEIVIAKELHNLRVHATYKTSGFIEVKSIKCIIGKYPEKLIKLWNIYDDNNTSDNDCPSMFGKNQLYIALELSHGGEDLEAFVFQTAQEAYALFLQTALALAVAEKALEFEHRDLHWGNVLISRTKESQVYYNLGGKEIMFPTNGVKVSIIDFTLSRMSYHECCIYNDLALDPALFTAHGEYQFDIYRLMHDKIQNNWRMFEPYTNVLWLHYILDKMISAVRYKRKNLKAHKHAIIKLKEFKDSILKYDSAFDFISNSDSITYLEHESV